LTPKWVTSRPSEPSGCGVARAGAGSNEPAAPPAERPNTDRRSMAMNAPGMSGKLPFKRHAAFLFRAGTLTAFAHGLGRQRAEHRAARGEKRFHRRALHASPDVRPHAHARTRNVNESYKPGPPAFRSAEQSLIERRIADIAA